jgi:hypothetical protein
MLFIVNFVVFALLIFGALALSSSGSVLGNGPEGDEPANRQKPKDKL